MRHLDRKLLNISWVRSNNLANENLTFIYKISFVSDNCVFICRIIRILLHKHIRHCLETWLKKLFEFVGGIIPYDMEMLFISGR